MPGDRNVSECPPLRYRLNDCKRAGSPHKTAPWAKCSLTGNYSAWYVGGGAAFAKAPNPLHLPAGRGRKSPANHPHAEGTWGMDYKGLFGHANVWLNYTRGREQSGEGAYETDGGPDWIARAAKLFHVEKHSTH